MSTRPSAPATERNRVPILEVLKSELDGCRSVLEIGSGTGQHAIYFAAALPEVVWQCSDRVENLDTINSWLESSDTSNVLAPLELDVGNYQPDDRIYDAVFSANTAHIMNCGQVERMFQLAGNVLSTSGPFLLYGPFNRSGRFTSESNARFDASLKEQNPEMGIRDIADLDRFAERYGLQQTAQFAMPANNNIFVWRKVAKQGDQEG